MSLGRPSAGAEPIATGRVMRALIVTTMRNEAPFLLEWLAYHRVIGFDDFLVFSNDCADGTDTLLDRMQSLGVLRHVRNKRGGKKTVQWSALAAAGTHPRLLAADWVMGADVDEFLLIHAGDGRLPDLIAAAPEADGFMIDWRMFGNDGKVRFEDRFVMEQFTRAAPDALLWPWRAVQFKSLYRNDGSFGKLGVHRPRQPDPERGEAFRWVDGAGEPVQQAAMTVMVHTRPRYTLAQLNHYALGSVESFLVKTERGRPNRTLDPITLDYWVDRNFVEVEDRRILRHLPAVAAQVAEWRAEAEVDRLHREAVAWREARIAALLKDPDYFRLYARILQTGPTQVLPPRRQRRLLRLASAAREAEGRKGGEKQEDPPLKGF
ncbi:MAG: glycosyltransferase family 2 protein [Pseudomonadota bacterium]